MTEQKTERRVREIPAKPKLNALENEHRLLRVAAYCRVSTELEQQQNSFELQYEYYTERIMRNPAWCLAGIFADEGVTGTSTKKRPGFMKMIRHCKQHKIDLILCKSVSRFARNTVDCLQYTRMLKALGVTVIFEKEGIDTSKQNSEMAISLVGTFAQSESESISGNVTWSRRKSFEKGKVPFIYGGFIGYRKGEDGKPEIVESEAAIIRRIYDEYLAGRTLTDICRGLERDGIPTARGNAAWSSQSVKGILTNERYRGDALLQKTFTVDCISKRIVRNTGQLPQYYVTGNHPAIIEPDIFDRVQEEMARRTSKRRTSEKTITQQGKYSGKYALSELLICGECGTPYRRCTWNRNGKKRHVWRCVSRLDHGTRYCTSSPTLDEEPLHRAVMSAICHSLVDQRRCMDVLEASIGMTMLAERSSSEFDVYAAKARVAQLKATRAQLISECHTDEQLERCDAQFERIAEEIKVLTLRIEEALGQDCSAEHKRQSAVEELLGMVKGMMKEDLEFDDTIVRQLVEYIKVIDMDTLLVVFKDGTRTEVEVEKMR